MYDHAYGEVVFGKYKGLSPFYKLLNQLLRGTLYPRAGDADNISKRAKNLLFQMAPGKPKFKVFNFIWNEIIYCSYDASSGCHYAPYIFHMIKHVSGVNILSDKLHPAYKSPQGKITQLLKIKSKAYQGAPTPSSQGASSSQAPPSAAPAPSSGPSFTPKGKKSKIDFLLQGMFSCFNMCKYQVKKSHEREQRAENDRYLADKRHKELLEKLNLPHSPVRPLREVTPPPPFANPWEDYSQEYVFGASQYQGQGEEEIVEEEEDVEEEIAEEETEEEEEEYVSEPETDVDRRKGKTVVADDDESDDDEDDDDGGDDDDE
jgi:hypothetical protein